MARNLDEDNVFVYFGYQFPDRGRKIRMMIGCRPSMPILDNIRLNQRLHDPRRVRFEDADEAYQQCGKRIDLCCRGNLTELAGLLRTEQTARGTTETNREESDARRELSETIG